MPNLELKPTRAHIKDHVDDLKWAWKRGKDDAVLTPCNYPRSCGNL